MVISVTHFTRVLAGWPNEKCSRLTRVLAKFMSILGQKRDFRCRIGPCFWTKMTVLAVWASRFFILWRKPQRKVPLFATPDPLVKSRAKMTTAVLQHGQNGVKTVTNTAILASIIHRCCKTAVLAMSDLAVLPILAVLVISGRLVGIGFLAVYHRL